MYTYNYYIHIIVVYSYSNILKCGCDEPSPLHLKPVHSNLGT